MIAIIAVSFSKKMKLFEKGGIIDNIVNSEEESTVYEVAPENEELSAELDMPIVSEGIKAESLGVEYEIKGIRASKNVEDYIIDNYGPIAIDSEGNIINEYTLVIVTLETTRVAKDCIYDMFCYGNYYFYTLDNNDNRIVSLYDLVSFNGINIEDKNACMYYLECGESSSRDLVYYIADDELRYNNLVLVINESGIVNINRQDIRGMRISLPDKDALIDLVDKDNESSKKISELQNKVLSNTKTLEAEGVTVSIVNIDENPNPEDYNIIEDRYQKGYDITTVGLEVQVTNNRSQTYTGSMTDIRFGFASTDRAMFPTGAIGENITEKEYVLNSEEKRTFKLLYTIDKLEKVNDETGYLFRFVYEDVDGVVQKGKELTVSTIIEQG